MSEKVHSVKLTTRDRKYLENITQSGKDKARKITRCRILLLADKRKGRTDQEISEALDVSPGTVFNIRRRFCAQGLESAINEKARSGQPPKFKGKVAARITALACSAAPQGHARWSLRLLADRIVELDISESISYQSVRNVLKKTSLNRT